MLNDILSLGSEFSIKNMISFLHIHAYLIFLLMTVITGICFVNMCNFNTSKAGHPMFDYIDGIGENFKSVAPNFSILGGLFIAVPVGSLLTQDIGFSAIIYVCMIPFLIGGAYLIKMRKK